MLAVVIVIGIALAFDFVNGFHDAANSIATVVSTRVLSPRLAVIWAAFFNFAAFLVFGTVVAATIATGVVEPEALTIGVIFAGLVPVLPPDRRPLLADVAADQPPGRTDPAGDAQRRVPGERSHLDRQPGAAGPGQHLEERPLIVADLHARGPAGALGGDLHQPPLHVVRRRRVGADVGGDVGVDDVRAGVGHEPDRRTGRRRRRDGRHPAFTG